MKKVNAKLGSVIDIITDYHANGSYKKLKENVTLLESKNFAIMIRTTNFTQNTFTENLNYINETAYNYLNKSKVFANDIIMNKIADAGSCYFMPEINKPVSLGMNLFLIRVDKKLANPFYIFSYLKFNEFYVKSYASGSATKTITKEDVKSLKILLPPLPEQRKIAKILGCWDRAIAACEQLIATSKQQKQALMQQLLTAKKRFGEFTGEWQEVRLGDIIEHKGGAPLEKYVSSFGSYYFISIGNYTTDGRYIDKGQRIKLNDVTKHKMLNKNDLVMVLNDKTKTGDIIGSTILIDKNNKYIYNQRSERIIVSNNIYPIFFWYLLNSKDTRNSIYNKSQGGTQIYINFNSIKSINLMIPTLLEQQKIAQVLTAADSEIDILQQKLAKLQQEKQALMQQLLTGKRRVKADESDLVTS